jgi:hypothetical protein
MRSSKQLLEYLTEYYKLSAHDIKEMVEKRVSEGNDILLLDHGSSIIPSVYNSTEAGSVNNRNDKGDVLTYSLKTGLSQLYNQEIRWLGQETLPFAFRVSTNSTSYFMELYSLTSLLWYLNDVVPEKETDHGADLLGFVKSLIGERRINVTINDKIKFKIEW